MSNIDFAIISRKAQRIPFLFLAAIFAAPRLLRDTARKIIGEPLADLAELFHRADIGFFVQLAQRRLVWIFVFIDAALRHLPHVRRIDVFGAVRSPSDENESGTIEHHHAGARPIG